MGRHKDLKYLAKDAGDLVQYACNMSGICFSFHEAVGFLLAESIKIGHRDSADWIANHPVVVAWVDKFDDLSCSRNLAALPDDRSVIELSQVFRTKMEEINLEMRTNGQGGDWRNRHPKGQDMVRRLVHVTKSREGTNAIRAMSACDRMAETGEHEPIGDL